MVMNYLYGMLIMIIIHHFMILYLLEVSYTVFGLYFTLICSFRLIGWTTPHVKQYQGDVTVCGMDTDRNWAPSF
jgi:hypothetical protein